MNRILRTAGALALAGLLALAAAPAGADGPNLEGVVNVNTATLEELQMLPGIGAARAQAVIEARKARGGFRALEDLLEVKGIGEGNLAKLRPHLTLQGKTTLRAE
jgi:competence protein ComEA